MTVTAVTVRDDQAAADFRELDHLPMTAHRHLKVQARTALRGRAAATVDLR
ncbi:MAG: hypothetical protein JXA67_00400 [Micromonosporaceae bacterium]|nr:hypothetical protein [Micromonosporaceae bacterium]